eukprot:1670281-Rhodomonas_salina.4
MALDDTKRQEVAGGEETSRVHPGRAVSRSTSTSHICDRTRVSRRDDSRHISPENRTMPKSVRELNDGVIAAA